MRGGVRGGVRKGERMGGEEWGGVRGGERLRTGISSLEREAVQPYHTDY